MLTLEGIPRKGLWKHYGPTYPSPRDSFAIIPCGPEGVHGEAKVTLETEEGLGSPTGEVSNWADYRRSRPNMTPRMCFIRCILSIRRHQWHSLSIIFGWYIYILWSTQLFYLDSGYLSEHAQFGSLAFKRRLWWMLTWRWMVWTAVWRQGDAIR